MNTAATELLQGESGTPGRVDAIDEGQHAQSGWWSRALHFGWWTILVGAIAMAATYPGRTHGLGMVIEPLLRDLNLGNDDGRVFYSTLNLVGTLLGALFCLTAGWMFDRHDRRWILAGNLILLGCSVLWMSTIETWQQLFVALILTRGLGQSALSVVAINLVAKSFRPRQLGFAMAWFSILSAPFHLIMIKGVGWALNDAHYDWRTVWASLGIALIALAATATLLRRNSAEEGKGERVTSREAAPFFSNNQDSAHATLPIPSGATLLVALRSPAFWTFGLTISLWGMIYSGVAQFNVDIFRERGFDERLYFNVLATVTVVALASKLFFGWLVNHVRITYLLSACLLSTAASLAGLPFATQTWHAYAYGVLLGIASGAVALLFFASWGTLFGRRELGRIQGVAQMLTVFASACGPLVFSYSKRVTSSYSFVFFLLAGVVFVMAIAAWLTPLPARSTTSIADPEQLSTEQPS